MANDQSVVRVHLELARGYQFVAAFPDLPGVSPMTLDEAPPLGHGDGPSPAALLAAAIGNCLAASLVFCLRKSHAAIDQVSADVSAHITRNAAGRLRITTVDVTLSPVVSSTDLSRLIRCDDLFEDFCIVTQSVRHGIEINVNVSDHEPPAVTVGRV